MRENFLFMFKNIRTYYRFFNRKFLTLQRTKKIISGLLLAVGILTGLTPSAKAYADARILNGLSTAQFTPLETATLTGFQFQIKDKNFVISQGFSFYHPGVDLDTNGKIPVYPIADGVVKQVNRWWVSFGHHVIIEHGNEIQSLYAHLSSIEVKVGDKVGQDTLIGRVGSTGWTTGDHLHLEIWQNGKPINPLEVLGEK